MIRKFVFALCLTALLQTRGYAFFSHNYPSYYRRPQVRRYHQQPQNYRHRSDDYGGYKEQLRRQQVPRVAQPVKEGKETIRDLGDHIELFIPCGRYCRYYGVQLKDLNYNKGKKVSVKGQFRNGYEFGRVFYENEWVVPDDVDASSITREITKGGYLKLHFPRIVAKEEIVKEAVPPSYSRETTQNGSEGRSGDDYGRGDSYHDTRRGAAYRYQEPRTRNTGGQETDRRAYTRSTAETGHSGNVADQHTLYDSGEQAPPSTPNTPISQQWASKPKLLEEEYQPPYPEDPDIEIEDVECIEDYSVKDKSASIGYWMREKFVFY